MFILPFKQCSCQRINYYFIAISYLILLVHLFNNNCWFCLNKNLCRPNIILKTNTNTIVYKKQFLNKAIGFLFPEIGFFLIICIFNFSNTPVKSKNLHFYSTINLTYLIYRIHNMSVNLNYLRHQEESC